MIKIQQYDFFIFDCDGVILDSNSLKNDAFRSVLKNEDPILIDSFINYHKQNGGVSRYEKFYHFYKNMKQSKKVKEDVSYALERFSSIVKKELSDTKYVPGVINFIKEIDKNTKNIYIVSGSDQAELISVFKNRNIRHFFKKIFGSPTEKMKNTFLVLKDNPKQKKGIFFGDSKLDFQCAKYYKMDFIFVKRFSEWEDYSNYQNKFLCSIDDFSKLQYA